MKKILVLTLIGVLFLAFSLIGCMAKVVKQESPLLPKINKIYIGETKAFKGVKVGFRGINDIGEKEVTGDTYYQDVVREYTDALKENLTKEGFVVLENPESESLTLKTKIGDRPPPLGGWLGVMAMGIVAAQVEIYHKEKRIFYFEEAANTANPEFFNIRAGGQLKRLAPLIVQKLASKFL